MRSDDCRLAAVATATGEAESGRSAGAEPLTYMSGMTISYARSPKRQRSLKSPQPALTAAIVTTRRRGAKPSAVLSDDPEADARVKAFFARNVRPLGT